MKQRAILEGTDEVTKKLKLVFLGDGGVGKTTLIHSFERESQIFKKKFLSAPSTVGIETHAGGALHLKDSVDYQVWDFAGQIEYGTIHQVCSTHLVCPQLILPSSISCLFLMPFT